MLSSLDGEIEPDDLLRLILDIYPPEGGFAPIAGLKSRSDFWPYQHHFVEVIRRCVAPRPGERKMPGAILALPPGAGKTATVLTAVRDLLDAKAIRRVLIVAPLLVAKTVWPFEPDEWAHLRHTTRTVIRAEDTDPDVAVAGVLAYSKAISEHQSRYNAEYAEECRRNPSKRSARQIVSARWLEAAIEAQPPEDKARGIRPKSLPSDLAEIDRDAAVAAAKEARLARLVAEPTELHIINKEALSWLWDHFGRGARWPYDLIIADDLREFRSGKRHIAKGKGKPADSPKGPAPLSRWGVLAQARKKVIATIELTGTPTPKGLHNLWGVTYLVDLGERLGTSRTAFERRWFDTNTYTREIKPKEHAFDEITSRIKDVMFSLDESDLAALPPFIIDPIRVELTPKVIAAYRQFEMKMVSEEYDVEAVNGGVLHGKLLQFANGSMYQEGGVDVWVHDEKIDALKQLVERLDGTPLLVAYTYQFDAERIMRAFPKAVVLRPENAVEVTRRWNRDAIPLLLAHRASAAHGLNMQKGSGHMCEYGLTSDAELYEQFLKRLLRPGRQTTVINHVIVARGTIDEDVYPMYLDPKIETQNRILESVRVRFNQ